MTSKLRVAFEAADRADLGEQLRGRDSTAARQLEECRRDYGDSSLELLVEFVDRSIERATAVHELARDPHLQLLLASCQPAADALEMARTAKHPQRDDQRRVELEQMPTQPLLCSPPLVDEIVAMIND